MSWTIAFVFLLGAVAECHGNTFRMGACPRVTVMKDVDFDRFLGEWFVVKRFNPLATCTKIVFDKSPEGTYSVNETSRPLGIPFTYHNQYLKARKIQFLRNDTNSIFRIERSFAHFTLSTFGIVTTDYENYALLWGCDPVMFGSTQNVDILSRQPRPEDDTLRPAQTALEAMGVDYSALDKVMQAHCNPEEDEQREPSADNAQDTNNIVAV